MGRLKQFDRDEVLDKAIQLFWKKGYADTSLSDLEKSTGVNKSGLYSEFKDKDDIFLQSLKRYSDQSPVYGILETNPLGWKNIENFLKQGMVCKGQKGCFLANTLRDYSLLPQKVKTLIEQNSTVIHEHLLKNVSATGTKKNQQLLASLISTFTTGLSTKLNVMKPEELTHEVDAFLDMCKS